MRATLVVMLAEPRKGVNDRLMTMRLPLSRRKKFATLAKAYANMNNPDEIKNKFHEDSNAIITTIPNADTLIILGGCDITAWEGVIGKHANHDAEPATFPKKLLFGEPQHGKLSLGDQKKRFKVSLKAFSISHKLWE